MVWCLLSWHTEQLSSDTDGKEGITAWRDGWPNLVRRRTCLKNSTHRTTIEEVQATGFTPATHEKFFSLCNFFFTLFFPPTQLLSLSLAGRVLLTPSEDVYVFLEKADRMRVLRPQLMSAKRLMNVGSRIVLGTKISLFHFVLSGWEREDSIRTSSKVEQGGALSEPNKRIERFEPVTATNRLWGLAEQAAQNLVNCCCRYKPKGGGWDIDPKLEYGTKPFLHERIGRLARAEGRKAKTKPLPKSLRYGFG